MKKTMAILCLSFVASGISLEPSVSGEQITMSGTDSQHESVEKKEDRSFFGDMWKKVKSMVFGDKETHTKDPQKEEVTKDESTKKLDKDDAMFSLDPVKNEDEKNTTPEKTNSNTAPSKEEDRETGIPVFGEVEEKKSEKSERDEKVKKSQAQNKNAKKTSVKNDMKKEEESDE